MDAKRILDDLFNKAKAKDEFEYICAILRIRGMESAGWDPLQETRIMFADLVTLIEAPLRGDTKIRLLLLLYSHLLEADAIYDIIENMLRTIEGKRCRIAPFQELFKKGKEPFKILAPSAKKVVEYLREHATRIGENELSSLLEWMFNEEIRNAFFHSDYTIFQDEFRSRNAQFCDQNKITHSIKLNKLVELINRGIAFFQNFMSVYGEHILSYKESKIIPGRFGSDGSIVPIELIVDPEHGIHRFRSSRESVNTA